MSEAAQQQEAATKEAKLGAGEMWGVFDKEDLEILDPDEELPPAMALFGSEDEAKGYVLLAAWGHMEPVIRPCKVSGTVMLTPEDAKESQS